MSPEMRSDPPARIGGLGSDWAMPGFVGRAVERLSAGEAGVLLMPVRHLRLAQSPAEVDLAVVPEAGEIAESVGALELHSQPGQLLDESMELGFLAVEFGLALRGLLGVRVVRRPSALGLDGGQSLLELV